MQPRHTFRIYTPQSLGAAIKHHRKRSGLTQAQLAELAGLNRTYVSDLEQGKLTEQTRRLLGLLRHLNARMTIEDAEP
jgi:transcriptional regulator with XRE-family HTH domain